MAVASPPKLLFGLFKNKNNTPLLERDPPKESPPPKLKFGNYCIKTDVYLENENNGMILAKLTGKSPDWDIIPQTVKACKVVRNGQVRKGTCGEPIVSVMSFDETCTGSIERIIY